jgi:lactate dehydrogenase-like 2-hydroxyacid dehydrogenase
VTEHQHVIINAKPLALHQQTRVGSDASRQSIDAGIVAAAGLDVYENEKPIFFQNLIGKEIKDEVYNKLK